MPAKKSLSGNNVEYLDIVKLVALGKIQRN